MEKDIPEFGGAQDGDQIGEANQDSDMNHEDIDNNGNYYPGQEESKGTLANKKFPDKGKHSKVDGQINSALGMDAQMSQD